MTTQAQINRLRYHADALADLADQMPDGYDTGKDEAIAASHKVEDCIAKLRMRTAESVGELVNVAFKQYGGKGDSEPVILRRTA